MAGGCLSGGENSWSVSAYWKLNTEVIFPRKLESPDMLC